MCHSICFCDFHTFDSDVSVDLEGIDGSLNTLVPSTSTSTRTSRLCETIAEIICHDSDLTILCYELQRLDLLVLFHGFGGDGEDLFTMFAPTDAAFDAVPDVLGRFFVSNNLLLEDLLELHAVSRVIFSYELECGGKLLMISERETTTVCDENEIFQFGLSQPSGVLPRITVPDKIACNGVIHVIDQVMIPSVEGLPEV